jgi:hypothetical protein
LLFYSYVHGQVCFPHLCLRSTPAGSQGMLI